jgi:hypothetical protein
MLHAVCNVATGYRLFRFRLFADTKWCGPGNVALDYEDLGAYTEEDKCCRQHDHCPDQLAPGQCLYGLCNNSPFTRSVLHRGPN